eukprot:14576935-Heterocapsa_arctica.AAC.1
MDGLQSSRLRILAFVRLGIGFGSGTAAAAVKMLPGGGAVRFTSQSASGQLSVVESPILPPREQPLRQKDLQYQCWSLLRYLYLS